MPSWQEKMKPQPKPRPTRVSRNGQIVPPARARREAGIEPGDLVVSVPVRPGALLVEKIDIGDPEQFKREYDREEIRSADLLGAGSRTRGWTRSAISGATERSPSGRRGVTGTDAFLADTAPLIYRVERAAWRQLVAARSAVRRGDEGRLHAPRRAR